MKKTILALFAFAIIFTACEKDDFKTTLEDQISNELVHITMPTSDYDMTVTEALTRTNGSDFYTSGIIEYSLDGQVIATVNYGDGTDETTAKKYKDGEVADIDLTQTKDKDGKEEKKYVKVVVEPLVVSEDCGFIVSGIIKYYDWDKNWLASIDFGDGTCDDIAVKDTKDGSTTFTVSDYF